jgi:hypothetical protein
MKAKDLIKALANIDPEADVVINVKQSNKRYGFQLPIEYGSMEPPDPPDENNYSYYLNTWINNTYGGSITVHLPDGAFVSRMPEDNKPV